MNERKVYPIYFSPTGTSKMVVETLAQGTGFTLEDEVDLTYPDAGAEGSFTAEDMVIIGVPVYAGRVPTLAQERLAALDGGGAFAVAVVVYGNREYEDALLELKKSLEARGFTVVACCTFIGEHSFSTNDLPIAPGRPDKEDLDIARRYGKRIADEISLNCEKDASSYTVPGKYPYQEGVKNFPFGPVVNEDICSSCGTCVTHCPAGAIELFEKPQLNVELCILCCACIKNCPEQAASIQAQPILEKATWLYENCSSRKDPEIFI